MAGKRPIVAVYPSIAAGSLPANLAPDTMVWVQAKMDGSQLSVSVDTEGQMHFAKKGGGEITCASNHYYSAAYLSLHDKAQLFQPGYTYHGEAICKLRHNTATYGRLPRFSWMLYEVSVADGSNRVLDRAETEKLVQGTGVELVDTIYHGPLSDMPTPESIVSSAVPTCLGGDFEGIVLKVVNRTRGKDGKWEHTRRKVVSQRFKETNQGKKSAGPKDSGPKDVSAIIESIGAIFDTDARREKAWQHLAERSATGKLGKGCIGDMVNELDADLLKEASSTIKDMLFAEFFPRIAARARGDVATFVRAKE